MAEIEKKEEITDAKKVEDAVRKSVITPEICSWDNDDGTGYEFEIYLPGVEKDSIKLRMGDDTLFITGESDNIRYVGSYTLCCDVDAIKAKSAYKNGLLKVFVPFKDIETHTLDVVVE